MMFYPWYGLAMLALESGGVIGLRCRTVLYGGSRSVREMHLMFSEKQQACVEAYNALVNGATANGIVQLYRAKVAANQVRLCELLA